MGSRAFTVKNPDRMRPCPKCGNTTLFVARAEQVAEDGCEVWIVCGCGFDPTAENTGHRAEDVWGALDQDTIGSVLECWNDAVDDLSGDAWLRYHRT